MDILLIGELSVVTEAFCRKLGSEYRLILCGNAPAVVAKHPGIRCFPASTLQRPEALARLFRLYSYRMVVCFGHSLAGEGLTSAECDFEQQVLSHCQHTAVPATVLLSANVRNSAQLDEADTRYADALRETEHSLAAWYGEASRVLAVRTPYWADAKTPVYPLSALWQQARRGRVTLAASPQDSIGFVDAAEVADLLLRVADIPASGSCAMPAAEHHTLGEAMQLVQAAVPALEIQFQEDKEGLALPPVAESDDAFLMKEYSWLARRTPLREDDALRAQWAHVKGGRRQLRLDAVRTRLQKLNKGMLHTAAVVVLFLLAELLSALLGSSAEFSAIDYRLLYVMLVACVYGMQRGVLGGVLASVGLALEQLTGGLTGEVLFFNLENWLPFGLYLILGAALGYTIDKKDALAANLREENRLLTEKYLFLKSAAEDLLRSRNELKQQVLGSSQSFGTIYRITRQLDKKSPEEIISNALAVLEETLENRSIAIYLISENASFARLLVSSKELGSELARSLRLADYPAITRSMQDGEVWHNARLLKGYPMYATTIYCNDVPQFLICIYKAEFSQMGLAYVNQIKVLCGLTQSAFQRAKQYSEAIIEHLYLPGTNLLTAEEFSHRLEVRRERAASHIGQYTLCRVDCNETDPVRLSDLVAPLMRTNDFCALDGDGHVLIVFDQTDEASFALLRRRFTERGLGLALLESGKDAV